MKYLLLPLLAFMAGCALVDVTTLDTAVPIPASHVQIKYAQSNGLDLSTAVITDDEMESNPDFDYEIGTWFLTSLNLAIGLQNQSELGVRFWASTDSNGGKLYYKQLIHQEGHGYVSIIPAVNMVKGFHDDWNDEARYNSYGGEIQLLYTYMPADVIRLTAALRGNYNRYTESQYDDNGLSYETGPYNIVHWGARGNLMLKLGPIFAIPEIGAEMIPIVNGDLNIMPVFGLGLGVEL